MPLSYNSEIPSDWTATLAVGNNKSSKPGEWKNKPFDFDGLVRGLTQHTIGPKDGPCFLQGRATGGVRLARAMETLAIVGIDVDNGMPSSEIDDILRQRGLFCLRYTTHSHGKDFTEVRKDDWVKYLRANEDATIGEYLIAKKRYLPDVASKATIATEEMTVNGLQLRVTHPAMDKNRLIFILAKPWSVHDFATQEEALRAWKDAYVNFAAWLGIAVDPTCGEVARLFYLPRREQTALYEAVVHQGGAVDIFGLPKASFSPTSSGNVFLDAALQMGADPDKKGTRLRGWAAKYGDRFLVVDALQAHSEHVFRPDNDREGIRHIECPFESEHTQAGGSGTFCVNAGESTGGTGFVVKCMHAACVDRDRLDFVAEMIDSEWVPDEVRFDPIFNLEVEDEEEEAEPTPEPAKPAPPPTGTLTLASVIDSRTADEYLRQLASSGQSPLEVTQEIDSLAAKLRGELELPITRTDLSKNFARYVTENARRVREAFREAERKKVDAERDKARRQKEKAAKEEKEAEAIQRKEAREKQVKAAIEDSPRPVIMVDNEDHLDSVGIALGSLVKKNDSSPYVFRNAGSIARISHDEQSMPRAERMGVEELRFELSHVTRCLETEGDSFKEVPPTNNIVKHILADPNLPFPVLGGIVTAPVFGSNGKINTAPGYDHSSQLYFEPPKGLTVPFVSEVPSDAEIDRALELLMDNVLVDFPFDGVGGGQSEKVHALCMILQPFVRQLISGATPIYLIVKPTPGTGASKLVNIYSLISTGEEAVAQTETRSEDEIRKRITSVLLEASTTFYLDNINYKIDSSALASAVTTSWWTDRLLGSTKTVRVPVKHTWIFAGNNPTMSNEIARRCVRIRLDAKVERPELRTNFKHKDLEGWVRKNRGELIWACLTIVQNWVSLGSPEGAEVKGSFEPWSRTMGGILRAAGLPGLLKNDNELRDDADEEGNAIKAMIGAWWAEYSDQLATAGGADGGLFELVEDNDIALPLAGESPQKQKISFGKYLAKLENRIFTIEDEDGQPMKVRIERGEKARNKVQWKLTKTD